jgi:hypothetical protein
MKPEVHYPQLLQDMDTRVRYILGENEQPKELKIQSDTMMSHDSKIQLKKTQDQIDHNLKHATAVTTDSVHTKASAATVTIVVEDQNCYMSSYMSSCGDI